MCEMDKDEENRSNVSNPEENTFTDDFFRRLSASLIRIANESTVHRTVTDREKNLRSKSCELKRDVDSNDIDNGDDDYIDDENDTVMCGRPSGAIQKKEKIRYQDVQSSITVFDGESNYKIEKWIEEIETIAEEMNWTPRQTLIYAKNALAGMAKRSLKLKSNLNSFRKLKDHLVSEFTTNFSSAEIHQQLAARRRNKDESLENYLMSMREIGALGGVEDQAIIEYTIKGIVDTEANKILLYGARTVDGFKEKLKLYKSFKENHKRYDNASTKSSIGKTGSGILCYNCGGKGHITRICPDKTKGAKCFKCLGYGHIATHCNKNANKQHNDSFGAKVDDEVDEQK